MLNKGPHIENAILALGNILRRMAAHQVKKRARLRRLRAWYANWDVADPG
jgi:pyruvate kinase